jgi:hypothetical protein
VDGRDSVLTGPERRRAVARIREQVGKGHGCTHLEAITMLDYVSYIQEELISVYSSEEYALAILDRRIECWSYHAAPVRA